MYLDLLAFQKKRDEATAGRNNLPRQSKIMATPLTFGVWNTGIQVIQSPMCDWLPRANWFVSFVIVKLLGPVKVYAEAVSQPMQFFRE